jgi:hypothetical protein
MFSQKVIIATNFSVLKIGRYLIMKNTIKIIELLTKEVPDVFVNSLTYRICDKVVLQSRASTNQFQGVITEIILHNMTTKNRVTIVANAELNIYINDNTTNYRVLSATITIINNTESLNGRTITMNIDEIVGGIK